MVSLPLRILLLEESEADAELILQEIKQRDYAVDAERVGTYSEMRVALARRPWDVVLCDKQHPQCDAAKTMSVIQESGLDIPLIIVADTMDEESVVTALKAGARDFLIKGNLTRLVPAIERELQDAGARREQRQAEEAVQQMRERFWALTENAPDGIALIDRDGDLKLVSPSARRIFGYGLDENPDINPADHTHPDDLPAFLATVADVTQNPSKNPVLHYRFKRKDGSWLWIESTFNNLLVVKSVAAIVINFRDITQRRQSEEKIRRQLERLTALNEIQHAISSSFDLHLSLTSLLQQGVKQLEVDAAAVLLFNVNLNTLEYAAGIGFHTPAVENTRVSLSESAAGRAVLRREMSTLPTPSWNGEKLLPAKLIEDENFVAEFAVPLIAKGKVKGVLEVFHHSQLNPDQEWIGLLNTLAGQAAIAIDNLQLFDGLEKSNLELRQAYDSTIEGWSRALDLRDRETEGHTQRATELTLKLARAAGMTDEELVHIRRGALLHDIGKLCVPDHILFKPDPFTDEEWVIMRKHPTHAYEMLSRIDYLRPALDIPYCHHERWDGSGYPRGLKGEQISLAARLFSVVDVYDALRSDRPYHSKWSEPDALEFIRSHAGTQFDPKAVELFLRVIEQNGNKQTP